MKIKKLFLVANIQTTALFLVICAACGMANAQYCNPAVVSYLVRDESGRLLSAAELKAVYEQLPKTIGDAQVDIDEVSLGENNERFYSAESVDWDKGEKVPALQFVNSGSCAMRLGKVTLTYKGKQMRLVFNLEITRTQPQRQRRWVMESLPFQEGAFAVDLNGWPRYENEVIPASNWKAVPDLTPDQPYAPKQLITDGRVIFKPILPKLQNSTRVPLRLPSYLAAEDESNQLYAVIDEATPTYYQLQFAFNSDCMGGTACRYGVVVGQALSSKAKRMKGKPLRLARGITGYFVDGICGVSCSYSTLSWIQNGYRYTVGIYGADTPTLTSVANSAITSSVFGP